MPIDFKYRAFLSYSHADTPLAKWLHSSLERFPLRGLSGLKTALGPVPKSLRPIFRDREDFSAGHTLNDQTIAALDASAALIVLCSPASAKSAAVNEEVRLFRHRWPDRLVVPVILAGKPNSAQECFPPALRLALDADGRITDQPSHTQIAPDIPEEGRELVLAKVVASLIGVPSDEVYRRAERERKRQVRIRYAVAAVILTLFSAGGYFGWRSYTQQQTLTDIDALVNQYAPIGSAEAARPGARERLRGAFESIAKGTAADPRYRQALDLIKAGKPKDAEPLLRAAAEDEEAAGLQRLKQAAEKWRTVAAIAHYADPKSAREYYAKAAKLDPDNVDGMLHHADMQKEAGNLVEAERAYNAVLEAAIKGKDDHDLLGVKLGVGDIRFARGNLIEALIFYGEAVSYAEHLSKSDPSNSTWQRALSGSYSKVGNVWKEQGNLPEALKAYRDSLTIFERLAKSNPNNAVGQRDLSLSYVKVGNVLKEQGNLPEALKAYRAGLRIAERLEKAEPGNAVWKHDLSHAYVQIGDALKEQGDVPEALKAYRDSLDIAERLVKADLGDARWQLDLSISYERVGIALKDQGNLPEAMKSFRDRIAIAERLAKADPGNARRQRDLSIAYNWVGNVLTDQGNLPEALNAYRDSLAIAERLAKLDPSNAVWQRDLSVSNEMLGEIYMAQGNLGAALEQYRAALDRIIPIRDAVPSNVELQRFTSVTLNKVGDVLKAQGNLQEAWKAYGDSLAIAERLAKSDPGNAVWQRDLSISYDRVGKVLKAQGNLPEALKAYRDSLAIAERLAKVDPGNAEWQVDVALAYWRLAANGDQPAENWRKIIDILQRLDDERRLAPVHKEWLDQAKARLAALGK